MERRYNSIYTLESVIEKLLVKKIHDMGGLCIKVNSSSMRGLPDRLIILNGHSFFVEVKSGSGKLSPFQIYTHKLLAGHGAKVYTVNSKEGVDSLCILISQMSRQKLYDGQ